MKMQNEKRIIIMWHRKNLLYMQGFLLPKLQFLKELRVCRLDGTKYATFSRMKKQNP